MGLREQINTTLKQAMKDKDKIRLATLRLINAAIKDQDIARRGTDGEVGLTEDDILGILGKLTKQRQESARAYEEGGRLDLAQREHDEIEIIAEFLPRQLSPEEITKAVQAAIQATDASTIRDMGKVMGHLKTEFTGRMDFGSVGPMVKEQLARPS